MSGFISAKTAANAQIATCTGHDLPTTPKSPPLAITTYKAAGNDNADIALATRNFGKSTAFAPPKAAPPRGRPTAKKTSITKLSDVSSSGVEVGLLG